MHRYPLAPSRRFPATFAFLLFLLIWTGSQARAQSSQSQLYQLYTSSTTPTHYKQILAKLLNIQNFRSYTPSISSSSVQGLAPRTAPSTSTTVDSIQTACNPLRRSCQPLLFRNLPANTRLRIYTLAGGLVKDIFADGTGQAVWDGTNQSGAPAASGVYFVFAQGAGSSKTIRIAVQR